jgi:Sulfotransferase family
MNPPHVLVHYHIFKNAGSSIDACLEHSFGARWGSFEGAHAHAIQSSSQLQQFIDTRPDLVAISSHLARPPLPHENCLPIVFIRHPLLRAYSVYKFTRSDSTQPFADAAQSRGFSEYVEWGLSKAPGSIVIRDYQVVHLSEASWRGGNILKTVANKSDLDEACAMLSGWGMAGVVEQFQLSVQIYQAMYSPLVPDLKLGPRWENATCQQDIPLQERVEGLREILGETLYGDFMDVNQLDLALHTHVRSLLESAAARHGLMADLASLPKAS